LEQKGYSVVEPSFVKTMDLYFLKEAVMNSVNIEMELSADWLEDHCRLSEKSDTTKKTLTKIISNILASKAFITLYDGNEAVSCGFGVIENGYVGIYNVVTDKEHRNKGYGEQLLIHLLNWAKANGAVRSYLQVVADNLSANRLYSKFGYEEIYTYWYRVKQPHFGGS
jgi:GNAT superfamily N-acetyltransferase